MSSCLKNMLFMSHANITQMVKTCYKIKIGFRDFACRFWLFCFDINPIIYKNSLFCLPIQLLLEGKRGCFV